MSYTLAQMRKDAARVILQENYLDKKPEGVREMAKELIAYTKDLLARNVRRKAEFLKMYDMRAEVSRAENAAKEKRP